MSRSREEWEENAIHGAPKRLRMENFTKQSLRIAPNSKVEADRRRTSTSGSAASASPPELRASGGRWE